jgi:hypothetical protein
MQFFQKIIQETFFEIEKQLQSADRLANILYPQLNDSKILLNALQQAYKAAVTLISLTLQYEYIQKRIRLSRNPEKNTETFFKNCAKYYDLQKHQIQSMKQLLIMGENYIKSGCTFSQPGKAIVLNDDGTFNEVTQETTHGAINLLQGLLKTLKMRLVNLRKL